MKEQTRSTEVQINEEEAGKLPENEFRIKIVKIIKTLKTKWRKCRINYQRPTRIKQQTHRDKQHNY